MGKSEEVNNSTEELKNSDVVSRRAVLQRLTDISYNHCKTQGEAEVIGLAKMMVNVMPSVQPDGPDTNVGGMISRQAAIDEIMGQPPEPHYPSWYAEQIKALPSAQPDMERINSLLNTCTRTCTLSYLLKNELAKVLLVQPEPIWGLPVSADRPLADVEIVPRLRAIQKQVGGDYAIDRAIEVIKAVAERRTDA